MDRHAQDFTKTHYNAHANRHQTQEEALRARQGGPGLPLKQFHNNVKRKLIRKFAHGVESLLDLACGRGGDLWKWIDSQVRYVKGMDLSPGEIAEAQKRIEEAKQKRPDLLLQADFEATEELGKSEVRLDRKFDCVTCMFAIHYFFASANALDNFFCNVSINLKDGGYFFGTVPDGRKVAEIIHTFGRWPKYESPMLKLEAKWQGEMQSFGSGYTCAIGDTVTEGHGESSGSFEYLVFRSTLVGVAAKHGFKPITDYSDPALDALFQKADKDQCCKHFAPKFPDTPAWEVDTSLRQASKLNMAFAFQKTTADTALLPGQRPADAGGKRPQSATVNGSNKRSRDDSLTAGSNKPVQNETSNGAAAATLQVPPSTEKDGPKRTRIG